MKLKISLLKSKSAKKGNFSSKELSDANLEKVVGGVSFAAALEDKCKRCKYKYNSSLAFNHSLV